MITYAKVGGPPDNWHEIEIIDLDSGKQLKGVVEVNTAEGWVIAYKDGPDGKPVIEGDEVVKERIAGRFEIREPAKA